MNQTAIGSYISKKRREKNLTQEQLAEKLGVSNKTISKWENGKCMPDYSIIEQVCRKLSVTLSELMDGEDAAEDSMRVYDDEQILDLLRRTQDLERQKNSVWYHSHGSRPCLQRHVGHGQRLRGAGLRIRSSDGAVRCSNIGRDCHCRKKHFEKVAYYPSSHL